MENNLLQALSGLLSKNMPNSQQNSSTQSSMPPLYPMEAYSQSASAMGFDQSGQGSLNANGQYAQNGQQNNLLPLLLTLFGQNNGGGVENLSKLLGQDQQSDQLSSLLSLFSSLSNKKKKENSPEATENSAEILAKKEEETFEGPLPTFDIL